MRKPATVGITKYAAICFSTAMIVPNVAEKDNLLDMAIICRVEKLRPVPGAELGVVIMACPHHVSANQAHFPWEHRPI